MRKQLLAGLFVSLSAAVFAGLAPNKEALAKVVSGEVTEAKLSWWGFDENDSTAIIKAAIASKATTLVVDKMASPWVSLPIRLKSNFTLKFEEGAEILAKRGEFKDWNDCLVKVDMMENVKIIGEGKGGILRMHKADYQGPNYSHGEWRHCIIILSSNNVLVENMSVIESGGDGIYVGVNSKKSKQYYSKDVVIRKCNCDRNHRQGISIIAAVNLLIEDTRMANTIGTAPEAGIDFEPNNAREPLINCVMRNCLIENNHGSGIEFYLPQQDASICGKDSFVIENCVARNDRLAEFNFITRNHKDRPTEQPWEGEVLVKNCVFEDSQTTNIKFGMDCWQKVDAKFVNCKSIDHRTNGKLGAPINITYHKEAADGRNGSNIVFENMVVEDTTTNAPISIGDRIMLGSTKYGVSGDITCKADGKSVKYVYNQQSMAQLFPNCNFDGIVDYDYTKAALAPANAEKGVSLPLAKIRHKGNFWVYLTEGKEATFTITYGQLIKNSGTTAQVEMIAASGKRYPLGELKHKESKAFKVTAPEGTGFYKIFFENGNNVATITKSSVPAGLWLEKDKGLNLIYMKGTYYMYVPEGIKEAIVCFWGDGEGEGVKLTVKDPGGNVAFEGDNVVAQQVRLDGKKAGIWSFTVGAPSKIAHEDLTVQVKGMPPFITTAPETLPVLKK